MSAAILSFPRALPVAERKPVDPFERLPLFAQDEAKRRLGIITSVLGALARDASINSCAGLAATLYAKESGEAISVPTVARWLRDYRDGGLIALAPSYKGRSRRDYGWEARAVELFNTPQRPAYATVALWLRQEGHASADYHLVRAYLKSMPSQVAETGRNRLGLHYYNQNIKPHIVRDSTVLPVGFVYQGDGHTCDVYVAAPQTGNPYRPELTVWIDVRSHYVPGWWVSESESAITTLFSFSNALLAQDHAPAMVHTDPGSGFTARVIADADTGFFSRFSIDIIEGLPGNARGHGLIEGFWRWFEERCGKRFETYCGHCRTDDALRMVKGKAQKGLIRLPTLTEYIAAIREYIDFYNRNPQDELGGKSPLELWETLKRVPLETPAAAVMRPRKIRTVRRWGIEVDGRAYRSAELQAYESRKVMVEYDLHDDTYVRILDGRGRYVCEALLVEKAPWLPASRIEQAAQKRAAGQQERLQIKLDEVAARARAPISTAEFIDAIESPMPQTIEAVAPIPVLEHRYESPTPAPASATRADRGLDATAHAEVVAACEAAPEPMETEAQRFARCIRLCDLRDAGKPLPEADARWLAIYETTSEHAAARMVFEEFGTASGVPQRNER